MRRQGMDYTGPTCLIISLFCTCCASPPNFVLLFADDLGFGDLGCYGHPSSLTPNLDRLAARGLRFTDFYSTSPVCSPSRASLLTGRYQTRSGVYPGVLYPGSIGGLPLNETTIAEVLKPLGYATAAMGKWHLGLGANGTFLPTKQGFDKYLGIPYSHDMGPCHNLTCFPPDVKCFGFCDVGTVTVPLMYNEDIKQQPVHFLDLEKSYSDFATNFIMTSVKENQPFFLYYPSHHTHYPQYAGTRTAGRSLRGPFGDALLELDNTIGDLMATLEQTGVINNTLIFFTSDNGPELMRMSRGGNAGSLKCGKGTTYEGGMREPAIAYWKGTIKPGVTHELASTLDILPTIASLAGAKLPPVMLDGFDMTNILVHQGKSKRETMMFYPTDPNEIYGLFALRLGKYKAHFYTRGCALSGTTPDPDCPAFAVLKAHDPPLIFDLEADPSEHYPLPLADRPDIQAVLEQIKKAKTEFEASMVFGESQVSKGTDPKLEPCCNPQCSPKPSCCYC
ncbi:arylsulfatase A [Melanotaenia boesemani]|uniref:arylsulfatase A n=1 Tax=Melanotaenia boesemani TaxID=1250792 RepID=UPI001C05113A|nr:arylsulfatase A [Melanotaenia boesemani]